MNTFRFVHAGLALSIAALVGCGSKSSPTTVNTTGNLTVTITAADGTTPSVVVTGPNAYSKQISTTTTLAGLAVGDYTIVADSASVPDSVVGSITDTGHVVGSPASVAEGMTAAATVTYATKDRVGGLWIARNYHHLFPELASSQLRQSGTIPPAQAHYTPLSGSTGLALDGAGNLWQSSNTSDSIAMYSIAARNGGDSTLPTLVIFSTALFNAEAMAFDSHGNLWVANCGDHSGGTGAGPAILEFSTAQLAAGGTQTPAVDITDNAGLKCPYAIAFDANGNAWVADDSNPHIVQFSAAQLASSGDKAPAATISGGGLVAAAALAFDASGNLWVANDGGTSVVDYTPAQLAAAGPQTPNVTVTLRNNGVPKGLAFDKRGTLWVSDWESDLMLGFTSSQLASSGSPAPSVSLLVQWMSGDRLLIPQQPAFDPFATAPAPSMQRVRNVPVVTAGAIRQSQRNRHAGASE